jgi:DUF1680 family protein
VAPSVTRLRPLGTEQVVITGGFWGDRQRLNAEVIIPHCEAWIDAMGWLANFDAAAWGRLPETRRGREFSDADVYKVLEAMAWEVGRRGAEELDGRLRAMVARIAAAQDEDGYLNTMFGRPGQAPRYSDLRWGHELYCIGHLIQAAVARGRTRGDDPLVELAVRAADHVCRTFDADGIEAVCGHPEIEVALVELYRYTGDPRYLEQARLFVERRGHGVLGDIELGASYYQDDVAVRQASVLRGHAVRALYLAAGAVDVAVETGDGELLDAVRRQARHALARRTYLTGGMGARHEGESFGLDYQLPPDRSYSETCAGVGSVMLNHRLLLATGDAVYADAVERTLYNVIAASPAADGRAFFYTNTLHQREPGTVPPPDVASPRASSSLRAPWYEVACCPPNLARTLASLGAYLATTDGDGVQLHQYADAEIRASLSDGQAVELRVHTRYPADGNIRVEIRRSPPHPWTLSMRVPAWATDGATPRTGGEPRPVRPGYTEVRKTFAEGEIVELRLPVTPRWTRPHPRIDAVRGSVAVERGPLVLCMESVDLGGSVNDARVDPSTPPHDRDGATYVLAGTVPVSEPAWPYGDGDAREMEAACEVRPVPLVPYHRWGNRGPSSMRVWLPALAPTRSSPTDRGPS